MSVDNPEIWEMWEHMLAKTLGGTGPDIIPAEPVAGDMARIYNRIKVFVNGKWHDCGPSDDLA